MIDGRFRDKVAIVTGAASGIGRATAIRLASEGAAVVATDRMDATPTIDDIRRSGGTAAFVSFDVRERKGWTDAVSDCVANFGKVDYLVNVAGVVNTLSEDSVVGLSDDAWDEVMDINLRGTWLGMQAVIPHMQARGGGRIVNVASAAALVGLYGSAAYSASKGGVVGLTHQAARHYAGDNILINAVAPGTIDTPIFGPDASDEFKATLAEFHLIKRLGRPEEVAGKIAYYLSDDGSFSTGQIERVDGGWVVNGG